MAKVDVEKIVLEVTINGKKAGTNLKELSSASRVLNRELRELTPGSDAFIKKSKELKKVKARMKEVQTSIHGTTAAMGRMNKMLGSVGIAFGAAFAVRAIFQQIKNAIRVIGEFDESVANLQKTTNLSKEAARALAKEIIKIDTRTSVSSLLELATAAGRLGLKGKEIIDFTKQADRAFVALSDSLEGDAEEIGLTLGKIAANFDLEKKYGIGEAINKVGSALNELGANSKAQEGFILDFTKRLSGISSQAKISLPDIQALGALFDETGQSVEVSATTFNKLLPAIGKDVERFAEIAGMNLKEFKDIAENDAFAALKLVATGAKSSEKGLLGLSQTLQNYGIDSARAASIVGVLSNNIGRLTDLQKISNDAFDAGTSLTEEFNIKNKTQIAITEKMGKAWDVLILRMSEGEGLYKGVIQFATGIIETFSGVYDEAMKMGKAVGMSGSEIQDLANTMGSWSGALEAIKGKYAALGFEIEEFGATIKPNLEGVISTSDAVRKWRENLEKMTGKTEEAIVAEQEQAKTIGALKNELNNLKSAQDALIPGSQELLENKKRIIEINGILKEQTKEQKSAYELEKKLLSDLKKQLDEQAFAGDINNETLARYKDTLKLIKQAEDEVTEALRATGTEARGMLEVVQKQADERIASIRKIQGASDETEAEILKTKLDSAKMQLMTLAKMQMKAGEAKDFQIQKEKELADEIVILENQIQAKKKETADREKEYKQASFDEQKEMLQQWYDDQIISKEEFDLRMSESDELLKEKQAEERETKKQEDIEWEKEVREEMNDLAVAAAQAAADGIFSNNEENRRREFDARLNDAQKAADAESNILNKQLKKDEKALKDKYEEDKKALKDKLDKGTITRKQYDDGLLTLDDNYENAALKLKDTAELAKIAIKESMAKKEEKLRREAFERERVANFKEAIISIALAVTKAMAKPAIPPFPSAIAAGVLGAVQLTTILGQKYEEGGLTDDFAEIKDGAIFTFYGFPSPGLKNLNKNQKRLITSNKDISRAADSLINNILLRKDGGLSFIDGGNVKRPHLALAGEAGPEWIAPNWMLESPLYADTIGMLESARRNRIGRFQEGGTTSPDVASMPTDTTTPEQVQQSNETQLQLINVIEKLNGKLDNPTPIRAFFTPDEIEDINEFNDELEQIKGDANIG